MVDLPGAGAELLAIHAEFAEEVIYTGAGLAGEPIAAVASDEPAGDFLGPGRTLRRQLFEIVREDLPEEPGNGDTLEDSSGIVWRVIDITSRRDIAAWVLVVEQAE